MTFIAIFMNGSSSFPNNPLLAEIDIRDAANRQLVPANATVTLQTTNSSNFTSGRATDGDLSTYYYSTDLSPFIAGFSDGEPAVSIRVNRGSSGFPQYAISAMRVYQSETNHGSTESDWPVETKYVDETYATAVNEWTPVYELGAPAPPEPEPTGLREEVLSITDDTWVRSSYPTSSYITTNYLGVGTHPTDSSTLYSYLRLPQPTVAANEQVEQVRLRLTAAAANSATTISVYRVDAAWAGYTWNTQPAWTLVKTVDLPAQTSNEEFFIDITELDGEVVGLASSAYHQWWSNETTLDNYKPDVVYSIVEKPVPEKYKVWSVPL